MNNNDFYAEYNDNETQNKTLTISETNVAFAKSYLWMFLGSIITFISGIAFSHLFAIFAQNATGSITFLVISIVSFIVELVLCNAIHKNALIHANFTKALLELMGFALLTGFTFSSLFVYFQSDILYMVFATVSVYFLILSLLSFLFRKKVYKMANFAFFGLIALLISSALISLFSIFLYPVNQVLTSGLFLVINIIGLVVFTILTIVDVNSMYHLINNSYNKNAASVAAGFTLYLDFINIFIYILRILMIFGKNSRNN